MIKFTPGPWFVSEGITHITVRGDNGEVIFHDDKRIDRVREDARLIAAAPELLEALENLHKEVLGRTGMYGDYYLSPAYNNALSAIAKARGEA